LNVCVATKNTAQTTVILVHEHIKLVPFCFYHEGLLLFHHAKPRPPLHWRVFVEMDLSAFTWSLREFAAAFETLFETCVYMAARM
jgi:hypothetical protein